MTPGTSVATPQVPMVAVLEVDGTIVWVNDAWQQFVHAIGASTEYQSGSKNFLTITRQADDTRASYIASEIRDVLHDDRPPFSTVYPCQTCDCGQLFHLYATGATIAAERYGLVFHRRITGRSDGVDASSETSDWPATASPHRSANRLVTYTIGPDETAVDGLLAAFDAIGIDAQSRATTLQDCLATDAFNNLFRVSEEFHLIVHVWDHEVVLTPDELSIYGTDAD